MGWGEAKYAEKQRRAVIHARNTRNLSGKVISELAARGELEQDLAPFEIPKDTVYSLARGADRKLRRTETSALVSRDPQDAVEELRRRLVEVLDRDTLRLVEQSKSTSKKPLDVEHVRKTARALRELASLPLPGERGRAPGRPASDGSGVPQGESRPKATTMAGQLTRAMTGALPDAARDDIPIHPEHGVDRLPEASAQNGARERASDGGEEDPGTYANAQVAQIRAMSVDRVA